MGRKKTEVINIRVDAQTKQELRIKAKNVGLSLSKFMMLWAIKGLYDKH
ncbi:hypothetical protein ACFLWM_02620 [Chloroflexota bacterium]